MAFSPNGKALAASDTDGNSYLWTLPAGKHPVTLSAEPHLFLQGGPGDGNGTIYLWRVG